MSALGHKRHSAAQSPCPLYPRKRTCACTSPCCFGPKADIETNLVRQLFDHLVGAAKHRRWHCETQGLGRLEIDYQAEFRWRLHRKVSRFLAFEYAVDV